MDGQKLIICIAVILLNLKELYCDSKSLFKKCEHIYIMIQATWKRSLVWTMKAPGLNYEGSWSELWRFLVWTMKISGLNYEGSWSELWRFLVWTMKVSGLNYEGLWSELCLNYRQLLFKGKRSLVWTMKAPGLNYEGPWSELWRCLSLNYGCTKKKKVSGLNYGYIKKNIFIIKQSLGWNIANLSSFTCQTKERS